MQFTLVLLVLSVFAFKGINSQHDEAFQSQLYEEGGEGDPSGRILGDKSDRYFFFHFSPPVHKKTNIRRMSSIASKPKPNQWRPIKHYKIILVNADNPKSQYLDQPPHQSGLNGQSLMEYPRGIPEVFFLRSRKSAKNPNKFKSSLFHRDDAIFLNSPDPKDVLLQDPYSDFLYSSQKRNRDKYSPIINDLDPEIYPSPKHARRDRGISKTSKNRDYLGPQSLSALFPPGYSVDRF